MSFFSVSSRRAFIWGADFETSAIFLLFWSQYHVSVFIFSIHMICCWYNIDSHLLLLFELFHVQLCICIDRIWYDSWSILCWCVFGDVLLGWVGFLLVSDSYKRTVSWSTLWIRLVGHRRWYTLGRGEDVGTLPDSVDSFPR